MLALEDPPPGTTVALVGLVLCVWLSLRVRILRRRLAARAPQGPPVEAAAWLRAVADARLALPLIAAAAAGFGALLAWSLSR